VQIKRDPQNSIADTIDNALRAAMLQTGVVEGRAGDRWTDKEQSFLTMAARAVMDALGLTDALSSGVWVVFYSDATDTTIHSVHANEIDALRISQKNGYFMPVKFMEFGQEVS